MGMTAVKGTEQHIVQDAGVKPVRLVRSEPVAFPDPATARVAVIGLGYVGLPLILGFAKASRAIGFDINEPKIAQLLSGIDFTGEVSNTELRGADAEFTTSPESLSQADVVIVCVPTPVNSHNRPDYGPLIAASKTIGKHMKRGAVVVFESTVDPGTTEDRCLPVIELHSGMKEGVDFHLGYSPERINPADPTRKLPDIKKIVAGSTPAGTEFLEKLYSRVIKAGLFPAASIRVAEAAKILENTQRDVNIALINELSIIFNRMGINTYDVLEAAGTKWNFLKFQPGLVGGHCIGVDPYYLTHKADMLGYHPQVILAGRRINDSMGKYVAEETVKQMIQSGHNIKGADVIVLGLTFKENCPDLRNSKVIDVIRELQSFGCNVLVHDPVAESAEAEHEYGVSLTAWDDLPRAAAIVAAVAHSEYAELGVARLCEKLVPNGVFTDVKSFYDPAALEAAGAKVWRL